MSQTKLILDSFNIFYDQEGISKNFIAGTLLQMRQHRLQGIPLGVTVGEGGDYESRLVEYLKTKNINDLAPARELDISQFYINPEDIKATKHEESKILETRIYAYKKIAERQNIKIIEKFSKEPLFANIYPDLSTEAYNEIFKNAIDAMPNGGEFLVETEKSEDQKHLVVKISDTGIGMSFDALHKALAGGFTTKPSGTGRGLGLVKKYFEKIIHGKFLIESEEGKGTIITITLPLAEK